MNWLSLKSGSDVRGTAIGEDAVLTGEVAKALGLAFAQRIAKEKGKDPGEVTIAVGRDSRVSGPDLLRSAVEGINRAGAAAMDFGMCTTPAMFMSTITEGFEPDGSIMITASHHPWMKNGLKFFTAKGGLEGREVEELLRAAETLKPEEYPVTGKVTERAFLPVYSAQLADRIRKGLHTEEEKPLSGLHIAVDAGNGAGGFYAELLQSLGADIAGSQFLDPDGHFPNHIPNPENKEAIESLKKAVVNSGADLGVIFDTDCDRAAVADADGKEINRNRLIALISAILLEQKPGQVIVTDSVTSSGLKQFIEKRSGEHYRFKRGYRNVIDEAIRLNGEGKECPLAIETSGHAALKENHFLDDGMYLVTVLIVKAMEMKRQGLSLGSLIADLKDPAESAEIRLNILEEDFRSKGEEAIAAVTGRAEKDPAWHIAPDNREGIRISFDLNGEKDSGWFLLRLSVHDPVLPLNAESDVPGGVKQMLKALYDALKDIRGIDFSGLEAALR
jgi:phosphomannomutase